jgi:hypothetical protein
MNNRELPQETGEALGPFSRRLATISPLDPDVIQRMDSVRFFAALLARCAQALLG